MRTKPILLNSWTHSSYLQQWLWNKQKAPQSIPCCPQPSNKCKLFFNSSRKFCEGSRINQCDPDGTHLFSFQPDLNMSNYFIDVYALPTNQKFHHGTENSSIFPKLYQMVSTVPENRQIQKLVKSSNYFGEKSSLFNKMATGKLTQVDLTVNFKESTFRIVLVVNRFFSLNSQFHLLNKIELESNIPLSDITIWFKVTIKQTKTLTILQFDVVNRILLSGNSIHSPDNSPLFGFAMSCILLRSVHPSTMCTNTIMKEVIRNFVTMPEISE